MQLPDNAPFTAEDRSVLNPVFARLAPAQRYWLSGFLAGVDTQSGGATAPLAAVAAAAATTAAAAAPAVVAGPIDLTILFGTESGNSEELAERTKRKAAELGFAAKVRDMAEIKPEDVAKIENLLVIVSTWGDGEAPDRVTGFHAAFLGEKAPRLEKTRFSVLALGDSSYPKFCQVGKDFDQRFEALGAKRIHPRSDCDVDYEGTYEKWVGEALSALHSLAAPKPVPATAAAPSAAAGAAPAVAAVAAPAVEYGKKFPFPGELKERVQLNGRGSSKETIHLEFSLVGSGMTYEAGDALAIIPTNCADVVADILKAGKWKGNEVVETPEGSTGPLADVLKQYYDITSLSKNIIKKYNELSPNEALTKLLDDKDGLSAYTYGREIADLLADYPISGLAAKDFVSLLRKLPPRLYSIASSPNAHPGEVHLTVGAVRYEAHGKKRKGVCSTFLAERAALGEGVPMYIHNNKNFKLPTDGNVPVIMVGPGTGIAPFRSFIEDRAASGAKGKNWLFFGDQHFTTDFLYQLEWQQYLKDGVLTRIDTAFSRDQEEKIYVQTRMLEAGKELYAWLEEGAYFYVCGDASRMANDVHQALISLVATHGGKSAEEAEAYIKKLQKDRRYCRDVY